MKCILCFLFVVFCTKNNGAIILQKKQEKQKFEYKSEGFTEEYNHIGNLFLHTSKFRVYNCFKRIETANGYRGQSTMLFLSNRDTLVYLLDNITDFPDSVSNNLFFSGGKTIAVKELNSTICLHCGCFELQAPARAILKSLKRLK